MRAAHNTCVPSSSTATKRILGKALEPRLAPGRPKAFSFSTVSAVSSVLPSRLINRHSRYHAPLVRFSAIGTTIASYSFCSGSDPRRLRACEMPDLPATCQRQIEMSGCLPSRNVRFTEQSEEADVRVDSSARGRARADAQGRGDDGAGSEESIGI